MITAILVMQSLALCQLIWIGTDMRHVASEIRKAKYEHDRKE